MNFESKIDHFSKNKIAEIRKLFFIGTLSIFFDQKLNLASFEEGGVINWSRAFCGKLYQMQNYITLQKNDFSNLAIRYRVIFLNIYIIVLYHLKSFLWWFQFTYKNSDPAENGTMSNWTIKQYFQSMIFH